MKAATSHRKIKLAASGKRRLGPDPRDIAVGQRVRVLRLERRLSQSALAEHLGLTFQQVQKYEKGTNRIGAGRLERIAEIFKVPVSVFFSSDAPKAEARESLFELVDSAAALRLLQSYARLRSTKLKAAFIQLAVELADEMGGK